MTVTLPAEIAKKLGLNRPGDMVELMVDEVRRDGKVLVSTEAEEEEDGEDMDEVATASSDRGMPQVIRKMIEG